MAEFTEQDTAALRAMTETHMQAVLDHDAEAFLATCTDDITFLPPGAPPLVGREACRQFLEEYPVPTTFTSKLAAVDGAGDLAFTRGTVRGSLEDGTRTTLSFVGVHRRQPDGSWRMSTGIWNSDDPPGP